MYGVSPGIGGQIGDRQGVGEAVNGKPTVSFY